MSTIDWNKLEQLYPGWYDAARDSQRENGLVIMPPKIYYELKECGCIVDNSTYDPMFIRSTDEQIPPLQGG